MRQNISLFQAKFLVYLVALYFALLYASYVTAYKMVQIGPILETAAIFLFPISFSIADIIAEIYGYSISRQLIWSSVLGGFLFCASIEGVISLKSPDFWHYQAAYDIVLGHTAKIYFAMVTGMVLGSFVNVRLILRWKVLLKGRYFWLRSIGSSVVGEFLLSIIAGAISFIGVEPADKIFWLMFNGFVFKLCYATLASFPSALVVRFLKRHEPVAVLDEEKLNPFVLKDKE